MSLWGNITLSTIGVCGEAGAGKSMFAASIDPEHTLFLDFDDGAENYESLGIKRIDVPKEMIAVHTERVIRPIDVFNWTMQYYAKIKPGEYSVIALDTASDFEEGIAAYVIANPKRIWHDRAAGSSAVQVWTNQELHKTYREHPRG